MTQPDAELVAACNKWEDDYRDGNGPTLAAFVRSRIEQALAKERSEHEKCLGKVAADARHAQAQAIERATAGAYEACRLKMLTLNDEFWSAVAAKDCVELMPEDAKRALAQAVAKARLESAKKVIAHAPGRLPQAVQDYIAELERALAEALRGQGEQAKPE